MKTTLIILFNLTFIGALLGQNLNIAPPDSDNLYEFKVSGIPPLNSSINTPKWLYYYEFGDGHYTKTDRIDIKYGYDNTGQQNVVFKAIKIYDEGDLPPIQELKLQQVNVTGTFSASASTFKRPRELINDSENFRIDICNQTNTIVPNEENVIILNLKNQTASNWSGKVVLLYNKIPEDKKRDDIEFSQTQANISSQPNIDHFNRYGAYPFSRVKNQTPFIAQGAVSNILTNFKTKINNSNNSNKYRANILLNSYKNAFEFDFNNLQTKQQNIFINLKATNQLKQLIDKGQNTPLAGILIDNNGDIEIRELQLKVVSAHDPNDITVSPTCLSCQNRASQYLTYQVRFQNDGNGKANKIKVEVDLPNGINLSAVPSIQVNTSNFLNSVGAGYGSYTKCIGNNTTACYQTELVGNKLKCTFYDANLRGFKEADSQYYSETTGGFSYALPLNNNISCNQPLKSLANIFFDNEPPVATNTATAKFGSGVSLKPNAIKAGFDYQTDNRQPGFFIGINASPNNCKKKWYNQFEVMLGYGRYNCNSEMADSCRIYGADTLDNMQITTYELKSNNYSLSLVPLHFRTDLLPNLSAGVGLEVRMVFKDGYFYKTVPIGSPGNFKKQYLNFDASLFGDINFGKIDYGPSVGLRYLYGFALNYNNNNIKTAQTNINRTQIYVQWNF